MLTTLPRSWRSDRQREGENVEQQRIKGDNLVQGSGWRKEVTETGGVSLGNHQLPPSLSRSW